VWCSFFVLGMCIIMVRKFEGSSQGQGHADANGIGIWDPGGLDCRIYVDSDEIDSEKWSPLTGTESMQNWFMEVMKYSMGTSESFFWLSLAAGKSRDRT
jgi:hypothetical protein